MNPISLRIKEYRLQKTRGTDTQQLILTIVPLSERDTVALRLAYLDGVPTSVVFGGPPLALTLPVMNAPLDMAENPASQADAQDVTTITGFSPGDEVRPATPSANNPSSPGIVDRIENGRVWVSWSGEIIPYGPDDLILVEAGF